MALGMSKRFKWKYTKQQLKDGKAPEISTELIDTENISISDLATLPARTSDPTLKAARIWLRSDQDILKYSPDGSNVLAIGWTY